MKRWGLGDANGRNDTPWLQRQLGLGGPACEVLGLGLGLGFSICRLFRVCGFRFGRFGVFGLGFQVWGFGFGVSGLRVRVWGFRFQADGSGGNKGGSERTSASLTDKKQGGMPGAATLSSGSESCGVNTMH